MSVKVQINGEKVTINSAFDSPLLYFLRNNLGLNGPKFGCGLAQCGSCTVLVNGDTVRSCQLTLGDLDGTIVVTLEGIGNKAKPHPLQQAFIARQALQCGYCTNGMIMSALALLEKNPDPSDEEIKEALSGNLCRCGAHTRILSAVQDAAAELRLG